MNLRAMEHSLSENNQTKQNKTGITDINGKYITFTGTLSKMTRFQAARHVRKAGAKFDEGVLRRTDILVVAPKGVGSVKHKMAKKYKIKIMSEKEFYKAIGCD